MTLDDPSDGVNTPPRSEQQIETTHTQAAENDVIETYLVTSVNGEQMRATRAVCDDTNGYVNVAPGPGYRFWGEAYVASAEREAAPLFGSEPERSRHASWGTDPSGYCACEECEPRRVISPASTETGQ